MSDVTDPDDIEGLIVERTIETVEFHEMAVEEWRDDIRADVAREYGKVIDSIVHQRLMEKARRVAVERTMNRQGENRLHNEIDHSGIIEITGNDRNYVTDS